MSAAVRVALYHRVSTAKQDNALARSELRAAARHRGMTIAMNVEETASSRGALPGRQRILEAARRGKVDALMVWKLDRLGRSMVDLVNTVRELRELCVRVISITQGVDLHDRNPAGDLVFNVLCAAAEFERETIRERTILGLQQARARGSRLGRPVTGPPPERVAELRMAGLSWKQVASELACDPCAARRAAER